MERMVDEDGSTMTYKTGVDEIKIICKKCNLEMVQESCRNGIQGIYVCPCCIEQVHIKMYHKQKLPCEGGEESKKNGDVS